MRIAYRQGPALVLPVLFLCVVIGLLSWLCLPVSAARAQNVPGARHASGKNVVASENLPLVGAIVSGEVAEKTGELGGQFNELIGAWSEEGSVYPLRTRLMERGQTRQLGLPAAATDPSTPNCATLAVLTTPNLSFLITFDDEHMQPARRAWPVPSAAGLAEVTRCGARKELLSGVSVQMRSRKGVASALVLVSDQPPSSAEELLSGRSAGPSMAAPQVGKRPHLGPLKDRISARRARYRREGAAQIEESGAAADKTGRGNVVLHLAEGCHVMDVLAPQDRESPPDLDAQLLDVATNEVVVADEEHSGQASLRLCVGRPGRVRLDFSGAKPRSEIALLHAIWELPESVPRGWGTDARAQLSEALWKVGALGLKEPPVVSGLGVRGQGTIFADVAPGRCYVFAVAPIRGDTKRVLVSVQSGNVRRQAHSDGYRLGSAVWFCAEDETQVRIEVQAIGSSLAWIAGLFPASVVRP